MIVLHFSIQGEDVFEFMNGKCHLCTLLPSWRPLCNISMHRTRHNTIEHTHAKILAIALERQVSLDNTYREVFNHQCNLTYL